MNFLSFMFKMILFHLKKSSKRKCSKSKCYLKVFIRDSPDIGEKNNSEAIQLIRTVGNTLKDIVLMTIIIDMKMPWKTYYNIRARR